jgi:hypothetical protein
MRLYPMACPPPSLAGSLNQISADSEIPSRFNPSGKCSRFNWCFREFRGAISRIAISEMSP